jgi:adenosylcobyric acid synthase
MFEIGGRPEGACSPDGQVLGTYLHGVFDTPGACSALLRWAGLGSERTVDLDALREASLERLADASTLLLEALITRR